MHIGTVAQLWRYPIKALAAQALNEAVIERDGLAGDRRSALIVTDADHPRSGKPYRGKEQARLHTVVTAHAATQLGADAGVTLSVVSGERYFDAQTVSVIFDHWLADVEALVGRPLEALRFRPNIFARAMPDFGDREAAIVGASIAINDVRLTVVEPIRRCVTTTYDVAGGPSEPRVLSEVARGRANTVGVYCAVAQPGMISRGDRLLRL